MAHPMEPKARKNEHATSEDWVKAYVDGLRPHYKENGYPLPDMIKGQIGFTSDGRKAKPTCEVLLPDATGGEFRIIVRCDQDEPKVIGPIIAHGCLHIVTGPAHNKAFSDAGLILGFYLKDGLRNARPDTRLQKVIDGVLEQVGPVPLTRVDFSKIRVKTKVADSQVADGKARQVARMRKAECVIIDGDDRCGYTVRIARSWIDDVGPPHCPRHGEMKVHWEDGDQPSTEPDTGPTIDGTAEDPPDLPQIGEAAE